MKNKKEFVYISGKISGLTEREYRNNFHDSEWMLARSWHHKHMVNPCEIKPFFGIRKWFFFMCADLYYLLGCSHVAFQKNWIDSPGAKIEMIVALLFNKKIIML